MELTKEQKAKNLEISEFFKNINFLKINQLLAKLEAEGDCGCVGAWLAKILDVRRPDFLLSDTFHYSFVDGVRAYGEAMGINSKSRIDDDAWCKIGSLLHSAGAPAWPFVTNWKVEPWVVFKRLSE